MQPKKIEQNWTKTVVSTIYVSHSFKFMNAFDKNRVKTQNIF